MCHAQPRPGSGRRAPASCQPSESREACAGLLLQHKAPVSTLSPVPAEDSEDGEFFYDEDEVAAGAGGADRVARLNALDALVTMPRADQLDEVRRYVLLAVHSVMCSNELMPHALPCQLLEDDPRFEDAEEEDEEERDQKENGEAANGSHPAAAH